MVQWLGATQWNIIETCHTQQTKICQGLEEKQHDSVTRVGVLEKLVDI